jgi:hypothetical protein
VGQKGWFQQQSNASRSRYLKLVCSRSPRSAGIPKVDQTMFLLGGPERVSPSEIQRGPGPLRGRNQRA